MKTEKVIPINLDAEGESGVQGEHLPGRVQRQSLWWGLGQSPINYTRGQIAVKCSISGIPWNVAKIDDAQARKLAEDAGIPVVIARLLLRRGITTVEAAKQFFSPSLNDLHDPSLLPDLDVGVERLYSAIESGEKICVHGDYDVDGVTSTALLVRTLKALKANVVYRLPHRQKEGYGIKSATVEEIVKAGASLILTCDCGITACNAVSRATELGADVIVTDHHEAADELPKALAVINPKRHDAKYPFSSLAGVGVALKFAHGLVRRFGYNEQAFLRKFADLAALGTVADVVPLLDENRAIVKYGLGTIPSSKKIGLQTMLRATNLIGKQMSAYYLAFVLGPRINAVGRMDDATAALKLLLTKDEEEARFLVAEMEGYNTARKIEQERILAEAVEQVESKDLSNTFVLVLSNKGWNSGVIGIVAGKICEQYGRPTILISRDEGSGTGHGSARSVDGFNIIDALSKCGDLLTGFGGHTLAAGLSIELSNVETLEEEINAYASEIAVEEEIVPTLEVDAELTPHEITRELADALVSMEPFGEGNPEPLFITKNMSVLQRQRVGDGSHLKMRVQGENTPPINGIAFGLGNVADSLDIGRNVDLCYSIRINSYNGMESVQLNIKDISY